MRKISEWVFSNTSYHSCVISHSCPSTVMFLHHPVNQKGKGSWCDAGQESPAMAFLCSCTLLFNLLVINTCHLVAIKANILSLSVSFVMPWKSRSAGGEISWSEPMCTHGAHGSSSFSAVPPSFTWTYRNIQAAQQITMCFSSQSSLSLSFSLPTGCLWSVLLISEKGGDGWRPDLLLGVSFNLLWVGWQHSSCTSSS